jgi:glycerol uptake facilitator-like aquaporin
MVLMMSALSTAGALYALIQWLGPLSGAHLNPLVSVALALRGHLSVPESFAYGVAQTMGALAGLLLAHSIFGLPLFSLSGTAREGLSQGLSETVATFGLIAIVLGASRRPSSNVAAAVAAYVGAAFCFTPTDFVNPALTIARAFTDSFAGIRIHDVPTFLLAQVLGAAMAMRWDRLMEAGASGH